MNNLKTLVLLATLTALLIWLGQALRGQQRFMMGLLLAGFMDLIAWWWSDKIVMLMYGGKEVRQAEAPELYEIVRNLAHRAEIPMPKVYVIPEEAPNAFATGRNPQHAAVAVTQ